MQVSWGRLHSPELLAPDVNEDRLTASATYTQPFGSDYLWSSTVAWGRKMLDPGETLDGFMLETALIIKKTYTLFARAERDRRDRAAARSAWPRGTVQMVNKVSVGGIYDIPVAKQIKFGVGALVSVYGLPSELKPSYGSDPTSFMLFGRLKVQ